MSNSVEFPAQFDQLNLLSMSKSSSSPARQKYYRLHLMSNTLTDKELHQTKQQQKFREYLEDVQRDKGKYVQIKQKMKHKFFKIKTAREPKLQMPPLLNLQKLVKFQDLGTNEPSSDLRTSRTYNISNSQEINKEIVTILENSLQLALSSKAKPKPKVRTRSELERKNREETDKEKSLIINFVKKSTSMDETQKKWEDLSNRDKYLMNFTDYVRKKTRSAIQSDVYERKIQKKSNRMEKFQDFILEQVKFSVDHKEKLSHFFKQIRGEFKRTQLANSKTMNDSKEKGEKRKQNRVIPIFRK